MRDSDSSWSKKMFYLESTNLIPLFDRWEKNKRKIKFSLFYVLFHILLWLLVCKMLISTYLPNTTTLNIACNNC